MPDSPELGAWAERLATLDLPVLRPTALAVAAKARLPDAADAHSLAAIALRDPLMCLRVLRLAAPRQSRLATPVEGVTAALVLAGIDPFFRDSAGLRVLEDGLDASGRAAVHAIVQHARAAARIAAAFAIHRQDHNVEEVHLAALLHDCAALLLWAAAPAQAPAAASSLPLPRLASALMQRWGLAESLRRLAFDPAGDAPGPRLVALAARLAHHEAAGRRESAPAEDYAEAAQLLHLQPQAAAALVRQALS